MKNRTLLAYGALSALTVLLCASHAMAGGLYLADRGVRALGRGGAYVVGADDGLSLWYNPAGLGFTGDKIQLHLDYTVPFYRASFERTTRDDFNPSVGKVDADTTPLGPLPLPIPTASITFPIEAIDSHIGFSLMAPSAVMTEWPESVGQAPDGSTIPGPTRYSLISMKGSAILFLAGGFAWSGIEGLSIGVGGYLVPARFRAGVYLSACDYAVLCGQAEARDYESPATVDLERSITATGNAGITYKTDLFGVGASVLLPYTISGDAKLIIDELPNSPLFEGAVVEGNKAGVALDFPMIVRGGVQLSPIKFWRTELDFVWEGWSRQQDFTMKPRNVRITNAIGLGDYDVGNVSIPRDMQDTYSVRWGSEMDLDYFIIPSQARMGFMWESSSFKTRTLTPLTLDSDKFMLSVGGTLKVSKSIELEWVYAHVFIKNVEVRDSIVYPANPLRPPVDAVRPEDRINAVGEPEPVGNGKYAMEADIIGASLRAVF